ncbi:MAG: hypothetical protein N2746_08735, partial [Deltaproteobacteria bacterium]|nr:hypothetical protein [Deltaproteobacteria bacterium]
ENMEGADRPSVGSVSGFALFNLRVLDKGRVYPAHELAYILENNIEGLKDLSAEIKKNISPRAYNIVLPPILGVSTSDKIIAFITESTGCKVFEAITFNNSIISNRFYHILKRYIEREGLKVIYDKIRKINKENDIITTITTDNFEICPEVVVLISERFVEEGLTIRENRVVEPIFNLPVFFNNSKNDISYFTEENIWGKHNIFSCGIKTDENFMPIDIYGDTVYKNLYSIGSIIINNLDPLKNLFDVFKLYTILRKRFNK